MPARDTDNSFATVRDTQTCEIPFEKWEERLPWVKKYKELSTGPLASRDCEALPKMRQEALVGHKAWAADPSLNQHHITPDEIEGKFQRAVNNIVSRFCEPIENRLASLVQNLESRAPEANDHELFTDELKKECIYAAKVRYLAKHDRTFNPKSSARNFYSINPEIEAAAYFEKKRELYKQRYLDILKKENSILQEKFSELSSVETMLQEGIKANKEHIKKLRDAIRVLMSKLGKKIEEQAPTSAESDNDSLPVAPRLLGGVPPPPPPAPPVLMPAVLMVENSRLNKKTQAAAMPAPAPALAIIADGLSQVKLRPVLGSAHVKPFKTDTEHAHIGKLLFSRLPAHVQAPVKIQKTESKAQHSIAELESNLYKNALSIFHKQQLIAAMQENIKRQKTIIAELSRQNRTLEDIDRQLEVRDALQKALSQSLLIGSQSELAPSPPPPPPPPPPPLASGVALRESMLALPPAGEPPNPKKKNKKESWMIDLEKKLKSRKSPDEDEPEVEEQLSEEELKAVRQKARLEFERKQREVQQKKATIDKHIARVREQEGDLEPSFDVLKLTKQSADLAQASGTWVQSTCTEVKVLLQKFEALDEVRPIRPIAEAPILEAVLAREVVAPIFQPNLVQEPELREPQNQLPDYTNKVHILLQADGAMLAFYNQRVDDGMLHGALSAVKNPEVLTRAVLIDLLVICDYVMKKREKITTKQFSPNVAELYNKSLDGFYQDALNIRLSNQSPKIQLKCLKEAANTHFKPGGAATRFFADAVIMISALCITGMVVGSLVIGAGLITSSFFSQKQTSRQRDFVKRLNDDNETEELLLKGVPGA